MLATLKTLPRAVKVAALLAGIAATAALFGLPLALHGIAFGRRYTAYACAVVATVATFILGQAVGLASAASVIRDMQTEDAGSTPAQVAWLDRVHEAVLKRPELFSSAVLAALIGGVFVVAGAIITLIATLV